MNNEIETIVDDEVIARVYEVSYILVPTMSEDAAIEKINSLKSSIAALGGSFISEESPYMRDLAYEMLRVIKNVNNRFDQGFFGWIKYEISPEAISKVDKMLKLDEDVIRYLIVKADRDTNIITKKESISFNSDNVNIDTTASSKNSAETDVEGVVEADAVDAPVSDEIIDTQVVKDQVEEIK